MKTISATEFSRNIKKYLDIAQEEKLLIRRKKGKTFTIVPIDHTKEEPYNPEFVNLILQGDEDYKNGKCVTIALEDLSK